MEFRRGQIVRSVSGRDKGSFLVVIDVQGKFLLLCDGKHRPLTRPKKKKPMHAAATKHAVNEECLCTDRRIREVLRCWNDAQGNLK